VQERQFSIFLLFAIEMAILNVFLQKKGLGSFGVKNLVDPCFLGCLDQKHSDVM